MSTIDAVKIGLVFAPNLHLERLEVVRLVRLLVTSGINGVSALPLSALETLDMSVDTRMEVSKLEVSEFVLQKSEANVSGAEQKFWVTLKVSGYEAMVPKHFEHLVRQAVSAGYFVIKSRLKSGRYLEHERMDALNVRHSKTDCVCVEYGRDEAVGVLATQAPGVLSLV